MKRIKVYIASPYTNNGEIRSEYIKLMNTINSMKVADELIELGFTPFAPLLNHYQDQLFKQTPETWYSLDLDWLDACDCVLRLKGESKGADIECEYADKMAIEVFHSIEQLLKWRENKLQK